MLKVEDFIRQPFTPDLTQAGIVYACRSLPYTYDRVGGTRFTRLRRIVVGKAVELGLRRLLAGRQVPFDQRGSTPFTDPDRYDLALGGRRVDVKSYLISDRERIREVHSHPEVLLEASALVPTDQTDSEHLRDHDLYIFAFALALMAIQPAEVEKARQAGQPFYWLHSLPSRWARPTEWHSLGSLALKTEGGQPLVVELGGQSASREYLSETMRLPTLQRIEAKGDFYALASLHVRQPPPERLGVFSPRLGETHLVTPRQWGNIWVYGVEHILAGWITRGEFRSHARLLPRGSAVWQYPRTRTANLAVPISELHPLEELFERVDAWKHSAG